MVAVVSFIHCYADNAIFWGKVWTGSTSSIGSRSWPKNRPIQEVGNVSNSFLQKKRRKIVSKIIIRVISISPAPYNSYYSDLHLMLLLPGLQEYVCRSRVNLDLVHCNLDILARI